MSEEISSISNRVIKPDQSGIVRDFSGLEVELLTSTVSQLSLLERRFAKEEAVLASLNFDQKPFRHDDIRTAHATTFEWVLSEAPLADDAPQHRFVDWLKAGDGIYWISGKPGSGKSTLMKFITSHRSTIRYLSGWAGSRQLVLAKHFFWNAGSELQRSCEGLLRTLLHDVLSQMTDLIPSVCGKRWKDGGDSSHLAGLPWSLEELRGAIQALADRPDLSAQFCFFIDGLDEFEGDAFDICRALLDLCRSSSVKMCISSRPWNLFETYLGVRPRRRSISTNSPRETFDPLSSPKSESAKSVLTPSPTITACLIWSTRLLIGPEASSSGFSWSRGFCAKVS